MAIEFLIPCTYTLFLFLGRHRRLALLGLILGAERQIAMAFQAGMMGRNLLYLYDGMELCFWERNFLHHVDSCIHSLFHLT